MKMEYVNVNGYLIPKLENGPIADNTIGKYGMMRARYLDEHRPMERDQMLLDRKSTRLNSSHPSSSRMPSSA